MVLYILLQYLCTCLKLQRKINTLRISHTIYDLSDALTIFINFLALKTEMESLLHEIHTNINVAQIYNTIRKKEERVVTTPCIKLLYRSQ